ncbi:malto-oligosyltrehalose trehalohydrolase [Deinococcus yavapaiensis]|uniref:Malto-oligosyltrehalose trehalohydrolase n=1 Tax=Deinococcus yavapaiensis KR-236 TaxID=694435 RepID=A0A318SGD4_9DEIO|nr:malto-oligosyltrehalose trehalohydrolase [Deinococcus yavapaiensis]PYE53121.1 maltooligosyl trehalose hydrolase [Deinococcus yavapaiensis KR-236]
MTDTLSTRAVPPLGAFVTDEGVTFRLWTTTASEARVVLYHDDGRSDPRPLRFAGNGVFEGTFEDVRDGARYKFELDGQAYPDPYARWLPDGVHGPAVVWTSTTAFRHAAPPSRPGDLVIYEVHVGTFTPEGTYRAATEKLPHLRALGVTCVELMPLSSFPGERGWGYDGVAHFAPFAPYGPLEDLRTFVDEAHALGLRVILDVVYNHFGPDGNYLYAYSPEYFTSEHKTPWGDALNYSNPFMRRLALDSAEHWLRTFGFDGLRLDATHEIHDEHPPHFLSELAAHVRAVGDELGTRPVLFCEDDRNLPDLVTTFGMNGAWADDFHHQVRVLLTGERDGYFACYRPVVSDLARCIERGWLYEGQTWPLGEPRPRGASARALPASSFVYCIQNHDQIGNRALGDRLQATAGEDGFLMASALLLFLPMTPLLFQGQEWMAATPFQYFSDHAGELGRLVTQGRLAEFGAFEAFNDPDAATRVPDPQARSTFENSKLDWSELERSEHARVLTLYRALLRLRRDDPVLAHASRDALEAGASDEVLWVQRTHAEDRRVLLVNFSGAPVAWTDVRGVPLDDLQPLLSTSSTAQNHLPAKSAVLLAPKR